MKNAREIVASYTTGRQFAHAHSADELLVMAYNEMAGELRKAQEATRQAEQIVAATVERIALDVTRYRDPVVTLNPSNPFVWVLEMEPMVAQARMLTSHPAKWDPQMIQAVSDSVAQRLAGLIGAKLYAMRKEAKAKGASR